MLGFRVSDFGFRVSGFGFRVAGFGFRVSGFGCRGSGVGFSVFGFCVSGVGGRGLPAEEVKLAHESLLPRSHLLDRPGGGWWVDGLEFIIDHGGEVRG